MESKFIDKLKALPYILGGSILLPCVLWGGGASSKPVVLNGPLPMVIHGSNHSMSAVDLDNDKRQDLVMVNNNQSRIELFYQRSKKELKAAAKSRVDRTRWEPILEEAPFLKEFIQVPDLLFAIDACDFDNDGLTDLIFTGRHSGIGIIFQTALGRWSKPMTYDKYSAIGVPTAITCADFDKDGKVDVLVLMQDNMVLLHNSGKRIIENVTALPVSAPGAQRVLIHDLNNDKLPDLLIVATREKYRHLYIRLQTEGGFGPELSVAQKLGDPLVQIAPKSHPCKFMAISEGNLHLTEHQLNYGDPNLNTGRQLQPMIYHPTIDPKSVLVSVSGDFTGQKAFEVAVADPVGSQLFLYASLSRRLTNNVPGTATFNKINSLAVVRLKGETKDSLAVCSSFEKMVGITHIGEDGRFVFPEILPVVGSPLLVQTLDLGNDGTPEIAVAVKDGRRFNLEIFRKNGKAWTSELHRFGSLGRSPVALMAGDFNNDGLDDLMMLIPREAARVFLQNKAGKLVEDTANKVLYGSQFSDLSVNMINAGDFNADGKMDLLICRDGYVRAFGYDETGALKIIGQANSRRPNERLAAPFIVDVDKDKSPELVIYAPETGELLVFDITSGANYIYSYSIMLGSIQLNNVQFMPFSKDSALFLSGKRQFWVIPFSDKQWFTNDLHRSQTGLKDFRYSQIQQGDLNNDGVNDMVAIDKRTGQLSVLVRNSDNEQLWESVLHFPVFEKAGNGRGKINEPREMVVVDVTNDGLADLVLLCHDRLLVYPQEKGK